MSFYSNKLSLVLFFIFHLATAQILTELDAPYHIKTVSFVQNNVNAVPVFELGSGFQFQFDDLFGNESNYYYEIVHCDYNWKPTDIPKTDYLKGFDKQRIQEYENSINTLQTYSHYKLPIPNQNTQLLLSGNYMLYILNENKEPVLSRKFILFEDIVSVPMQVKRARTIDNIEHKHNLEFSITSKTIIFQNPLKNVKVVLLQNGQFNNSIQNVVPQYTLGNDLVYKYDTQTQFWAGNDFLYFDNNNIRTSGFNVSKVDASKNIYSSYLFTNNSRANSNYSLTPDANGGYIVRNINATNNAIEADYSWVYFSLSAPLHSSKKNIYVSGLFNNYSHTEAYKLEYNAETALYEKAILIKQGYTNFCYQIANEKGVLDHKNAIDGNFWQTENEYTALVYYRQNTDRYDKVIGKGVTNSTTIGN